VEAAVVVVVLEGVAAVVVVVLEEVAAVVEAGAVVGGEVGAVANGRDSGNVVLQYYNVNHLVITEVLQL
jgi:hypothetical protein